MTDVLEKTTTLKEMRRAKGRTAQDVAAEMTEKLGRPISGPYLIVIENRGTRVYELLAALSEIYAVPIDRIAAAAPVRTSRKKKIS